MCCRRDGERCELSRQATSEDVCQGAVVYCSVFLPAQVQSVRQELQGLKHLGHRNLARYMDLTYDVDQDNITVQVGGAGGVVRMGVSVLGRLHCTSPVVYGVCCWRQPQQAASGRDAAVLW